MEIIKWNGKYGVILIPSDKKVYFNSHGVYNVQKNLNLVLFEDGKLKAMEDENLERVAEIDEKILQQIN
jgi:hypothetical protein